MRRRIAGLLRRTADRISPPPRIEIRCSHDGGEAIQRALLQLKRRNGGTDLGLS